MVPRRRGPRAAHPRVHPLERDGDGRPRQPPLRRASAATSRRSRRRPRSTTSGFNHFFRGKADGGFGDQVFIQGHAAPGHLRPRVPRGAPHRGAPRPVPARGVRRRAPELPAPAPPARLLGVPDRLDGPRPAERRLPGALQPLPATTTRSSTRARRRCGASSATARWTSPRRPPGSSLAAREQLDNLIFVVNCNLQRLDGPVRGNGKVIQELEATFRGAGWNVIKVIWGRGWDELLARDVDGVLVNKMNTTVDGEFQKYSGRVGRVHPRALLRSRSAAARRWSSTSPTRISSACRAAVTTTASSTRPTRWRSSTRAARR